MANAAKGEASAKELGDVGDAIDGVDLRLADDPDHRRAPRVLVDLEVDYALEDNYLFAYITNISSTGIFLRTTTPEEPGTHLNLRFSPKPRAEQQLVQPLASQAPLELEGEVIWVNPYRPGTPDNLHPGMGIRFIELDNDARARLLDLIRRFAYLS